MKLTKFIVLLVFLWPAFILARVPASGPVQTIEGPGGKSYLHQSFSTWEQGKQQNRYQVFEPSEPQAKKSGLVILLHDRFSTDSQYYAGLIRHLCRRGWTVLFPLYQGLSSPEKDWHINAAYATRDFLMQSFYKKKTELDKSRVIIIGHGSGGVLAANLGATSDYFSLPKPSAIMSLMPSQGNIKLLDLTGISRTTRLLIVSGDRISPENDNIGREIFYGADRIKSDNKVFVTVLSDFYGQPPLVADESAPLSPEKPEYERLIVRRRNEFVNIYPEKFLAPTLKAAHIDAFDWFVVFRFFDMLAHSINQNIRHLKDFKNTPEFRFMGYWSDGRKLKGLIISDRP